MKMEAAVVGGGLAGCESALQLSARGVKVRLIEMRPVTPTPAHSTSHLAELVCSNSLKSDDPQTASGLLKRELRMLGCRLLPVAEQTRVPAGHALAVDRELFAEKVTGIILRDPFITLELAEQKDLDIPSCTIIATGPLTSDNLSRAIQDHFSSEHLHFYDAISISVGFDSIDTAGAYRASRYGKGGDDYWNIPFAEGQYRNLVKFLRDAPKVEKRGFEEDRCFEACLPVEVLAGRGEDALRFGPMKPRGLPDPRTGRDPYAVLQLRQETHRGDMLGLVGFQTRLTRTAQNKLMKLIPGLWNADILRWGAVHRNTFLDSPNLLDVKQMSKKREGLFFSGQLVGVEGYMESMAHGLITALNVEYYLKNRVLPMFPPETLLGALQRHLTEGRTPFQPMNVNFGILPPLTAKRKDRNSKRTERSLSRLREFIVSNMHPAG